MKKETLMLITDISGYTRFLMQAGHEEGLRIAKDLLQIIINSNSLGLKVCEVEGDAVFFYSAKRIPKTKALMQQIGRTYRAFNEYLSKHNLAEQLGIKFFVHTGLCEEMKIGGRTKLYGTEVIRIHRLLKSVPNQADYLLVTDAAQDLLDIHEVLGVSAQAEFPHIGTVDYTVFDGAFILASSEEKSLAREVFAMLSEIGQYATTELGHHYRQYMSFPYTF